MFLTVFSKNRVYELRNRFIGMNIKLFRRVRACPDLNFSGQGQFVGMVRTYPDRTGPLT